MSERYEIYKLDDLFKVPAERRAACFAEIARALSLVEEKKADIAAAFPWWLRWAVRPRLSRFTWIDDGLQLESIALNGREIYSNKGGV